MTCYMGCSGAPQMPHTTSPATWTPRAETPSGCAKSRKRFRARHCGRKANRSRPKRRLRFATRELATILGAGRGLHERVREALETHVATRLYPAKVASLAELGAERVWRWVHEVAEALPRFLDAPKVWTPDALTAGIADGVQQGVFGYVARATATEDGSLVVSSPHDVKLREPVSTEHLGLGEGAALLMVTLADRLQSQGASSRATGASQPPLPGAAPGVPAGTAPDSIAPATATNEAAGLRLTITATEGHLCLLNQSLSKLRDLLHGGTMQLNLTVEAGPQTARRSIASRPATPSSSRSRKPPTSTPARSG